MPRFNESDEQTVVKARSRRRKGVAAICALSASAIAIPVVGVQAHNANTCSSGALNTNLGICQSDGGHGDGGGASAAPSGGQQQQQQGGGGGGGGGGASSSSSSSSSAGAAGSSS